MSKSKSHRITLEDVKQLLSILKWNRQQYYPFVGEEFNKMYDKLHWLYHNHCFEHRCTKVRISYVFSSIMSVCPECSPELIEKEEKAISKYDYTCTDTFCEYKRGC